jgi:hypothetical protein
MPKRHIRMISAAVAVAIPLGAAVCGAVAVPSAQAQTITVSPSRITAPQVKKPVIGMNLYVQQNYSLADVTTWGERDLAYIADTLKLKAVAIDWNYNVPYYGASVVESSPTRTPTIADLRELTKIAESDGLRVQYRALFTVNNSDKRSSSIVPRNLGAWLSSLLRTERPALRLAQREHVREFVVGTEMASVDQSPLWRHFFRRASHIYRGALSYASWGGRAATGGFFDKGGVRLPTYNLGATAYPPIDLPRTATVAELTTAWEQFLTANTPSWVLRRTSIDEMGIPAIAGAYHDPWVWTGHTGPLDPAIQANWYQAACAAVTAEHMSGLYFWSMPLDSDPANPYPSLVGWEGNPASIAAIQSC